MTRFGNLCEALLAFDESIGVVAGGDSACGCLEDIACVEGCVGSTSDGEGLGTCNCAVEDDTGVGRNDLGVHSVEGHGVGVVGCGNIDDDIFRDSHCRCAAERGEAGCCVNLCANIVYSFNDDIVEIL